MEKVHVNLGARSYPIFIDKGILPGIGQYCADLGLGRNIMVVTNPTVNGLFGEKVIKSLEDAGFQVILAEIPDGEEYKNLEWAANLYDKAFEVPLDRKDTIMALAGGVIGDLAGFVAATYMRGLNFVQVPTTLLAQVDSSVGGKVAVNHPQGKNIIGAFYQPKMVFADVDTLATLPQREYAAGLAEVVKYGVIWDEKFFSYLEENVAKVFTRDSAVLTEIVKVSCTIKARVVEEDETETGLRAILNYGHTFGHALETLTGYTTYSHGEAIAVGMVTAARLAVRTGRLDRDSVSRLENLLKAFGLPVTWPELNVAEIADKMYYDKKMAQGKLNLIVPLRIGKVEITPDISREDIVATLTEMQNIYLSKGVE